MADNSPGHSHPQPLAASRAPSTAFALQTRKAHAKSYGGVSRPFPGRLPSESLPGGRLGGIFKLDLSDQFKVKTELAYSMTGAKTPGYHIRLHNVSVPVSFVYSPIEFVNIEAGAEVNLIIDATTNAAIDYASLFDKFDFGLNLGL